MEPAMTTRQVSRRKVQLHLFETPQGTESAEPQYLACKHHPRLSPIFFNETDRDHNQLPETGAGKGRCNPLLLLPSPPKGEDLSLTLSPRGRGLR